MSILMFQHLYRPVLNCKSFHMVFPSNAAFCFCRGAAASAQQPGYPEHCGGASRRFNGPDADCWSLDWRHPHPDVFPGWGRLSPPHYGSPRCGILTGQSLSGRSMRGLKHFLSIGTTKLGQNINVFIRLCPKMRRNFSNLYPRWRRFKIPMTDSGQSSLWFRVQSLLLFSLS